MSEEDFDPYRRDIMAFQRGVLQSLAELIGTEEPTAEETEVVAQHFLNKRPWTDMDPADQIPPEDLLEALAGWLQKVAIRIREIRGRSTPQPPPS
jgi:hypothetical protein